MKKLCFIIVLLITWTLSVNGQDRFTSTQYTFDASQKGFPTWSPDGTSIIYSVIIDKDSIKGTGLWKLNIDNNTPKQIFVGLAEHPRWSPDGQFIAFDADSGRCIQMIPVKGGIPVKILPDTVVIRNGGSPCWSPDGMNIAFREGKSMTICIANVETKNITRIFSGNGLIPITGCWTKDGKYILIRLLDRQTGKSSLWRISADGKEKIQLFDHHEGLYRYLDLSPDGSLLLYGAMEIKGGKRMTGFWIMPSEGGKSIQIVSNPSFNDAPQWSPDGKRIAFGSSRSGSNIWIMDVEIEQLRKELRELNGR